MSYKLIPAKHAYYGGLLRGEQLYLPVGAAIMALNLETDGSVVVNEDPQHGQIQSWRKTCGVTHAFCIHGNEFAAINLMLLHAMHDYQEVPCRSHRDKLELVSRMMYKCHTSNGGNTAIPVV